MKDNKKGEIYPKKQSFLNKFDYYVVVGKCFLTQVFLIGFMFLVYRISFFKYEIYSSKIVSFN